MRSLGPLLALCLAAGGASVVGAGPPAAAALPESGIVLRGEIETDAPCSVGPGPADVDTTAATATWSDAQHVTSGDPAKQGDAQVSLTSTVTSADPDGGVIHVGISGTATVGHAADPTCHNRVQASGQVTVRFHLARAGWVTTTRRVTVGQTPATQAGTMAYGAVLDDADAPTVADLWAQQTAQPQVGTGTGSRFLAPGDYVLVVVGGVRAGDAVTEPVSVALDASVDLTLAPGGAATGMPPGSTVVVLPAARDCAGHAAVIGFTRRIRKAKKVVVRVNGATMLTRKRPRAADILSIPLPDTDAVQLAVVVTWRKRAVRRHPRPARVVQSYLACRPEVS